MITPADAGKIILDIQGKLKAKVDPAYTEVARRTIGDEERVMGVRVPEIKIISAEYLKSDGKSLDLDDILTLADECFKTEGREEQLFAVFILSKKVKKMNRDAWRLIDNWVDYISNWETCDQLATQFAGKILLSNIDLITDLKKMAKQTNVWRRRFAAAATVVLNHGGHSNPTATFEVLLPMVSDNDQMVRKAVAWSIREAGKADEDSAFNFMLSVKDDVVKYVLKHGSEKFSADHQAALGVG